MNDTTSFLRSVFCLALLGWLSAISHAQPLPDEERSMPAQITFIPPFGTNGHASPQIVNNFSLNVLIGITGGVQGLELGGLMNHAKGAVHGVQIAGLGNYAGKDLMGAQFGGLYNVCHGAASGAQFAGLGNFTRAHVRGAAFAGLYNVAKDHARGAQFAGLINLTGGPVDGAQFAGLTNINTAETRGHQYAGIFNYSQESLYGAQVAGLVNKSKHDLQGFQAAGLVNLHQGTSDALQLAGLVNLTTADLRGCQIAGLVNIARNVRGFQLGLVNIADTVESGAPLGLFSIVRNGYRRFELEANETFYLNFTFKMGTEKLYTIYTVGFRPQGDKNIWSAGIGLGTYRELGSKAGLSIEGIAGQVNEDTWWTDATNLLNRVRINASYNPLPGFSVYGGLALNVQISRVRDSEGNLTGSAIDAPMVLYEEVHHNTLVTIYPGFHFGLRF